MGMKFNPFTGTFDNVNPEPDLSGYIPTTDYTDFVNVEGDIMTGNLLLDKSAGVDRLLAFTTEDVSRWQIASSNQAESGSNAGSNFFINRFNDDGDYVASPFIISRATGEVSLEVDLAIAHGGTGASDASTARSNLGLGSMAVEDASDYLLLTGGTIAGSLVINNTSASPLTINTDALIVDGATDRVAIGRSLVTSRTLAVGGASDFYGELNMVIAGDNTGAFKAYLEGEGAARFQFTNKGDVQWGGGSGPADTTIIRRAANRLQTYGDFHFGAYDAPTVKINGVTGYIALKDGITAPSAETGFARIYVDTADGDLKVKFGDGVVATIAVDA